ncbi:MAG: YigZ family protein [Oscillospiraceae bacterium]
MEQTETSYDTIQAVATAELTEKRSRFIAVIAPISTCDEASAFVASQREAHHDARHTVWAWRLKEQKGERCCDDGEPQGTGGSPVLEVLRRAGLVDVCVAVTRYFGGVLLGAGGLTRAYGSSAALAVTAACRVTMRPCVRIAVQMNYAQQGLVARLWPPAARVENTVYDEAVTVIALIPAEEMENLAHALTEATAATVSLRQQEYVFAALS